MRNLPNILKIYVRKSTPVVGSAFVVEEVIEFKLDLFNNPME